ncbi:MAG: guanylate kinase [Woeseia sp.]
MHTAKLFVIAAPSGAGKTTLVKALLRGNPRLSFSISYTTRKMRSNEVDGRDYFFVSKEEFARLDSAGELLESAWVFDNRYGTGRAQVEARLAEGRDVILEIDWQGARQVRQSKPDCVTIFILPPSLAELERRLRDRRTDSEAVIARRLEDAIGDMSHWHEFDYAIVNDDLKNSARELEAIVSTGGCTEANRTDRAETRGRFHPSLNLQ